MRYLDDGTGHTAASLIHYREHRHRLGTITEADVYFPGMGGPYPYCMILRDTGGNEIWLSGCAAGYAGEGARAAMEVLVDAGWRAVDAREVFTRTHLQLRTSATGNGARRQRRDDRDVGCTVLELPAERTSAGLER
jgi:hypothetical protein